MHGEGLSQRAMARRLGVSQPTVRNAPLRMGLPTRSLGGEAVQAELLDVQTLSAAQAADASPAPLMAVEPLEAPATIDEADADPSCVSDATSSEDTAAAPDDAAATPEGSNHCAPSPGASVQATTLDCDPDDRVIDREMARQGLLTDAAPLFRDRDGVPAAGVLLAVPLLVASGVLDAAHKVYGDLGPAFYGLRNTLMTLLFYNAMIVATARQVVGLRTRAPSSTTR